MQAHFQLRTSAKRYFEENKHSILSSFTLVPSIKKIVCSFDTRDISDTEYDEEKHHDEIVIYRS